VSAVPELEPPAAIRPDVYRKAMGRFATGVTILTVAHEGQPRGMTANAFMSVSLEPPLIVVSVAHKARMHQYLAPGRGLGVNILCESQEALCLHFGGRPDPELEIPFRNHGDEPLLQGSLANIVCRIERLVPAGDHELAIARVEHLAWTEQRPLLFFEGRFHQLGDRPVAPFWLVPDADLWG
jgi:flavin reductase (DIM6/NTAB) family NADH-FMN oxidoreductase RutF